MKRMIAMAFAYFLCVGLFLCFGCTSSKEPGKKYTIIIDSIYTKAGIQDLYDYRRIVEGIWFISSKDGSRYACGLKDYYTIACRNLDNGLDTVELVLTDSIHSFVAEERLYCVSDNKHKITILDFTVASIREPEIDSIIFDPIFDNNVFNASNLHGPMIVGSPKEILIPYNLYNSNPNLLDTYVYRHIHGSPLRTEKLIAQPHELLTSYQFMNQAIGTFNASGAKLFYMFESIPKLYRYDMLRRKVDSVLLPEFRTSKYDADKQGDFTYLRNYLSDNDANRCLLYDANFLYLVKRNAETNPSKYTLFCFDTSLRLLTHIDVPYKLNTEVVFINDDKLYIYAHKSNNKFYTFSVVE